MKPFGLLILTTAVLALAAPGLAADADPEPPPPIEVDNIEGAAVTVSSGPRGPVLKITTYPGKAKIKARIGSLQISFTEKQAPTRLTFHFKKEDQLILFWLSDGTYSASLQRVKGKQVAHFDAEGAEVAREKGPVLTLTVTPGKGHLEVELSRPKGKPWPKCPWTVQWRCPLKR
jgi:hypothetical protein